jgi:hypothetical protein
MFKYKVLSLIIITIALTHLVRGQTTPVDMNDKLPVDFLREDLRTLRSKLESSQPGLYLYTRKDSLDKIFEVMENSINEPMTSIEFFRIIAPLNKLVRNLHTRFWPSAEYEKDTETDLPRFPLDIYWHKRRMYVLRNHSTNENILAGSVVKSINGEGAESVFQKILNCRVRDGFNESYPVAQASRNFSYYYAQLIGTPETFRLELAMPDATDTIIEVRAVTAPIIHKSRAQKYAQKYAQYSEDWDAWIAKKELPLRFEMKDDVAVMTVRTFYFPILDESGQNYEEFFKKSFAEIGRSKTKNLIIDLRNNHGGSDPVGMALMSHLHDSTFYYYKKRSTFMKPDTKFVKKGNIYEIKGKGVWTGRVKPAKDLYKEAIYVLMNGYSVSATGEFIGHLKNINRAVFIGEEAGGNPVTFTGGESLALDLPHSRITGTIPFQWVEMNVRLKNTGHGVIPDYEVRPSIEDILEERDIEMELVMKLISENLTK